MKPDFKTRKANRLFKEWCRTFSTCEWHHNRNKELYDANEHSRILNNSDEDLIKLLDISIDNVRFNTSLPQCSPRRAFDCKQYVVTLSRIAAELRKRYPEIPAEDLLVWLSIQA